MGIPPVSLWPMAMAFYRGKSWWIWCFWPPNGYFYRENWWTLWLTAMDTHGYWLVVSNMAFIFHNMLFSIILYGMSSFPLTNSYFSRWLKPPTRYTIFRQTHVQLKNDNLQGNQQTTKLPTAHHMQNGSCSEPSYLSWTSLFWSQQRL